MAKTAFITGIAGQDGSYLSEYLLGLGYRVTGIIRRNSTVEHQRDRLSHLEDLEIMYGDLLDQTSLENALHKFQPDEIYNLAAQSHVRISAEIPQFTTAVNAVGALNLLESFKRVTPNSAYYQASSSEMFGNSIDSDGYQRETTQMTPVSPYGCAKLYAFNISKHYRTAYDLPISNGILFNHESPRRGSNFVTNKVVKTAVEISLKKKSKLELGNLDSFRDWGHSYDYVRAMHLIVQSKQQEDWVVATGEARSVRELCEFVFNSLGMEYTDHVVTNSKYLRPQELNYLKGDSTRIRNQLGWKPKYTFETMILEMIEHWKAILS